MGAQILAPKKWNVPSGASACVAASLRPLVVQVTVCPKNLSTHHCELSEMCSFIVNIPENSLDIWSNILYLSVI